MRKKPTKEPALRLLADVDSLITDGVDLRTGILYGLNKETEPTVSDLHLIESNVDLGIMLDSYQSGYTKYKYLVMVCCAQAINRKTREGQDVRTVFLSNKVGTVVSIRFASEFNKPQYADGRDVNEDFCETIEAAMS